MFHDDKAIARFETDRVNLAIAIEEVLDIVHFGVVWQVADK